VYIGIEWKSGSPEAKKLLEFLNNDMLKDGKKQIRWDSGVELNHFANWDEAAGTQGYQVRAGTWRKSVTLVHKATSRNLRRVVSRLGL